MCPQKNRRLSDAGPITFPPPASVPKAEEPPSDLDESGDVIIDPYGNLYCFVCKVSVPRGQSNVSQHLGGKKHDTNNKRFATLTEKAAVRARVVRAAEQQREHVSHPSTADTTDSAAVKVVSGDGMDAKLLRAKQREVMLREAEKKEAEEEDGIAPVVVKPRPDVADVPEGQRRTRGSVERAKRDARVAEAKRLSALGIDKGAYLSSLLKGGDSDDGTASEDEEESDLKHTIALEDRQKPFGPLSFSAPEGPDYLFESMAEETEPSKDAAKLRELLVLSNASRSADTANAPTDMEPGETLSDDLSSILPGDRDDYLSLSNKKSKETEEEDGRLAREKARKAREDIAMLRDINGDILPPWLLSPDATENVLYSSDSSVALHYEILEFSRYMSPTQAERASRSEMVLMVGSIVKQLWPSSTIQVFGSYATGLYLPTSDIDICVMGTPLSGDKKEFEQLAEAIRNVTGFARRVNVIKAKVSLVKIIARKNGINCDISIGVDNGPKNVPVIKQYLKSYPALRPLLLVVKCFLQQRDLNEVYSGGLGSYTVLLLVVSHLQMLRYNFPTSKSNLGAVLQQFFQLYGRMFNFCIAGIRVKDKGSYFDKFEKYETTPHETMRFSVEDPNDETNELGRNGFGALKVRRAFYNASMTFVNWRRDDSAASPTPLGSVIQCDSALMQRRAAVIADFEGQGKKILRNSVDEASTKKMIPGKKSAAVIEVAASGFNQDGRRASHGRANGEDHERVRDPRLAKRRRANQNQSAVGQPSGNTNDGMYPGNGGAFDARAVIQGNAVMTEAPYMPAPSHPNYDPMMLYGHVQPNYPTQPYPASTPGYQYLGQQPAFVPNAAPGMADPMYHGGYVAPMPEQNEQGRGGYQNSHVPEGAGRRRRNKRGTFPRRGGYRGR